MYILVNKNLRLKLCQVLNLEFKKTLFEISLLILVCKYRNPDESFKKEFNPSTSEIFRNLYANHSEPIRKLFESCSIKIN